MTTETREFQAETRQLLDLMIHSIYSHKEIFLRELISNASDALDKLRFEALTDKSLLSEDEQLEIRIDADKENRTLTISDNGIGMSPTEVVENIGTIAKSGTREMLEKIKAGSQKEEAADLIGQFGVGFYSAFMIADKVSLVTRKAGEDKATFWESTGDGKYQIGDAEKDSRGTTITLHLIKPDTDNEVPDFTDEWVVESTVKKYSDFIAYPIILKVEKEEVEKDEEGNEKEDGEKRTVIEDKTLNSMKPIWQRQKSDVKDEEYHEFYKHISHDWNNPLKVIPYRAEGRIEYTALLFIPEKAPFDFYYQTYKGGLQLYVKKVMISEALEELLPKYLRFVKGVVESADLPLNISREMLQHDKHITLIRKGLTTKILSELKKLLEKERDKYDEFWAEFGNAVKEGCASDFENQDKLKDLLIFATSGDAEKKTTLKEYVGRMHPDQKEIYFITGESRRIVENSPHLEKFKEKGYEVLYLLDPVDELVFQHVNEYDGKKIRSVGKGDIELDDEKEKEKKEKDLKEKEKDYKDLNEAIQKALDEHVKEVKLTSNLVNAPARVVGEEFDMSPHLEKILSRSGQEVPKQKKILELNSEHDIVKKLKEKFSENKEAPEISKYAHLLLGYAILSEGGDLPDAVEFNSSLAELMKTGL